MLQRNTPLVNQLISALATEIVAGELVASDGRLPSEAELSERYAVSRATVREALSKLELAGVVVRRHGVGTFVNRMIKDQPGLIRGWLDEAPAFVDLIAQSGHTPSQKVLNASVIAVGEMAEYLNIGPDASVIVIEKLYFADATPIIFSQTTVPHELVEASNGVEPASGNYHDSIYQLLKERSNRRVNHQNSEMRAVLADDRLAGWLECQPGAPLLQLEEIGYDLDQTPLFYALHHFRGDRVSFRQIRRPTFLIESQ
jgi:GntR family transcriptional regulator